MSIAFKIVESFEKDVIYSNVSSYARKKALITAYGENWKAINDILHDSYEYPSVEIVLPLESQVKIAELLGADYTTDDGRNLVVDLLKSIGFIPLSASNDINNLRIAPREYF